MKESECRERMAAARVARLATAGTDGRPHLVPITIALVGNQLVTAIDHKPKSTTRLRRLRNLRENPAVSVLGDHYDEDWTRLWWVRADGTANIVAVDNHLLGALVAKYPQYHDNRPDGPLIVVTVTAWSGWTATSASSTPDV